MSLHHNATCKRSVALPTIIINLSNQDLPPSPTDRLLTEQEARGYLKEAGYAVENSQLTFFPTTYLSRAGLYEFKDVDRLVSCYGSAGYIEPLRYQEDQRFDVEAGSCFLWTSRDSKGRKWSYHGIFDAKSTDVSKRSLNIHKNVWIAMIAGSQGLCLQLGAPKPIVCDWLNSDTKPVALNPVTVEKLVRLTQSQIFAPRHLEKLTTSNNKFKVSENSAFRHFSTTWV